MKKLLIIGGSGFFGKSIVDCGINRKLIKHKINEIYIISRSQILKKKKIQHIRINYIHENIINTKKIPEVDYIIYCIKNESIKVSNNCFNNFYRLINNLSKKPKILFASSGAIYGKNKIKKTEDSSIDLKKINALSGFKKGYALEKVFMENKFQQLGKLNFNVSIARCFNFVGKHILDSKQAIGDMLSAGLNNDIISLNTTGNVYRGYMNADDLVHWLIVILKNSNKNCPVFNVGSDKGINIRVLGKKISKIFNKKLRLKKIRKLDSDYYVPSISKAKKLLKLKISINLNDSLKSFIKNKIY
ncbi:NAD(P)-dependent oxidoreductase [Candidatus Pelagibacter sp.]|nr:NAD(P)-dependent oxidoreductase [Candidatus Pelagibacter sp.]